MNTWDKVTSRWRVVTESGLELTANIIISGSGALHVPKIPDFPGAETFRGEAFHTAQWHKVESLLSVDCDDDDTLGCRAMTPEARGSPS